MTALRTIGDGLVQAFFMAWETLWALVLGFTLSGAVQAFVTRGQMERILGRPGARTLTRATFLGMVSSSCSYAATAMAKSLFAKGADLTAALVFMIASTNLVIELGIVLALLIGWQFTASEFVGGFLMIAMFGVISRFVLPARLVADARRRLTRPGDATAGDGVDGPAVEGAPDSDGTSTSSTLSQRLRSADGWADAARYAIADMTMIRRELVIGFTVAGLLAALVPATVWGHVFVTGHGVASSLENVLVGPLIAILSFVCSIGNVPLAAALWKGGISFGGVVAFVFADLLTLPLLLVYRRYFGGALTLRILAGFWLVMSASGLVVEAIFGAFHAIPSTRPLTLAPEFDRAQLHERPRRHRARGLRRPLRAAPSPHRRRARTVRPRHRVRDAGGGRPRAGAPGARRRTPVLLLGWMRRHVRSPPGGRGGGSSRR